MTDYNAYGLRTFRRDEERYDVTGMFYPGRCTRCYHVYDGSKVTVVHRYSDCSMWHCPGCNQLVDDRPIGWGGSFQKLNRDGTVQR